MRMSLVLELQDVPGQLVAALEPIASVGANIVTIIHERDAKTGAFVPVQITIEGDEKTLDLAIKKLTEKGIRIIEKDGIPLKEKVNAILVGKISEEELKGIVDNINTLEGVKVADLSLKMSTTTSTIKITMEAEHKSLKLLEDEIHKIGAKEGLLVITET
ncbi:MAG: allosteric regulator of homoserine dehydrogenase [Methanobacteriales archaeon]|nr:allosteric regulator of homoserine dehydrogenase [Methanobacteriales archaeon]